jgi:hypothetical protein
MSIEDYLLPTRKFLYAMYEDRSGSLRGIAGLGSGLPCRQKKMDATQSGQHTWLIAILIRIAACHNYVIVIAESIGRWSMRNLSAGRVFL